MASMVTKLSAGICASSPRRGSHVQCRGMEKDNRRQIRLPAFANAARTPSALERFIDQHDLSSSSGRPSDRPSSSLPDKLASKRYEVVHIVAPETEIALPLEQPLVHPNVIVTPPSPPLPAEEPLQPPIAAKLIAPKALIPPKRKPAPASTVDVPELNEISAEAKFEAPPSEPAKPREPVKTGTLAAGGAAPAMATADKTVAQVQTGGFGDPSSVPGDANPTVRANIAHAGSPALLPGPGFGNGTGGAKGVRGTVASSGFGNGVAISAASQGEGAREPVKAGGFGAEVTGSDAPSPKQAEAPPPVQPVVILSKPNPAYTDEARRLRLEGDVGRGRFPGFGFGAGRSGNEWTRARIGRSGRPRCGANPLQACPSGRQAGGFSGHRPHRIPARVLNYWEDPRLLTACRRPYRRRVGYRSGLCRRQERSC